MLCGKGISEIWVDPRLWSSAAAVRRARNLPVIVELSAQGWTTLDCTRFPARDD